MKRTPSSALSDKRQRLFRANLLDSAWSLLEKLKSHMVPPSDTPLLLQVVLKVDINFSTPIESARSKCYDASGSTEPFLLLQFAMQHSRHIAGLG